MKNVFGNNITYTLFGESHGSHIGIVIDGLPAGIALDKEYISRQLALRQPSGNISTSRKEEDFPVFVSGVKDGFTEGTPVTILIENKNVRRNDYDALKGIARPGHADYAAQMKYQGYQDQSGGGHFSGRLTAPLVAAGAIVRKILEDKGIYIGSHISRMMDVKDRSFDFNNLTEDIKSVNERQFPVLDETSGEAMKQLILAARERKDSVGGILETAVAGLPAGIGEPFFSSLESVISSAIFSIGGVKGISFGAGFEFADMYGSQSNDPFRIEDGRIVTTTNNNGGINGGISNGMPVLFSTVIKPTSSIGLKQQTVNYEELKEVELEINGRHDPAIIHRARVVVDCMTAMALTELLVQRYGYLWLVSK